jgi:uncharacterized YigZ family protein
MLNAYRTVAQPSAAEFIINKSRFIGCAAPCQSEEEALAFIRSLKEVHRTATHHCYAYVIGANAGIMRYQDDGEPSGTAGLPIMEVLKAKELVNLCVVVVRYFGGVLLGAGGLVRAYSKGAALAVDSAHVVMMEPSLSLHADIPYPLWDKVQHRLKSLPVEQRDVSYAASIQAELLVRVRDAQEVVDQLTQATDGRMEFVESDPYYYGWPSDTPSA